ncbi:hypothetical protein [Seonamhaeicola sp.]|uniref:fibronectin type III domain-containing protein n=1 Tax=Seonamhaeicola sp. TaxID=1912245 RepID=UPI00263448D6|nr:hypothetical protein [Seonamhaeicola sp.]
MSAIKSLVPLTFGLMSMLLTGQQQTIEINTQKGHAIKTGSSGFNVRIADKVWNYTHPDFRKAVHELKPGWLRFFSGTMGDAFNAATGQYDLDYAYMFDKSEQYLTGYKFTEIKGPHRLTDLYQLLGEINGRLIVTINAFSETPEITKELVRFIKNNNIEVEVWQFCNEPYFYVPHRERYWWNDGYDYAQKMKPHADEILKEFPQAHLALNFTWDGIWAFMKEINAYQKEHGAFWNTFSKHSYAPHIGRQEPLVDAYRRGNTKLLEATGNEAMAEIEEYTEKDIPMLITEFGVWNRPLNGIYSSIYNIEYVMRQLQHANTTYIGAHEVSNKYVPEKDFNHLVLEAFEDRRSLNTDSISTGVLKTLEGKAFSIFHKATNNVDWVYHTVQNGKFTVPGLEGQTHEAGIAQSYRGIDGYDYLVLTNRGKDSGLYQILVDGKPLKQSLSINYLSADNLEAQDTQIKKEIMPQGKLRLRPYSITVAKWKRGKQNPPAQPRIYKVSATSKGVDIVWGPISGADSYQIRYGNDPKNLNKKLKLGKVSFYLVKGLSESKTYYFSIVAKNQSGNSKPSNPVSMVMETPATPEIFKTARRDDTATIMWRSVPYANGYLLKYEIATGESRIIDTKNVFGYRVEDLQMDVPYLFSVASYNGLGQSTFSPPVTIVPKKNVPYSPRNVSVREIKSGTNLVQWEPLEINKTKVSYTILRGTEPHKFNVIARGISGVSFEDKEINGKQQYFYTVKAENASGESNFYPNIATPIKQNQDYEITIESVGKNGNGDYVVDVSFSNIPLDGLYSFGIIYNNISYLTVEENRVEASSSDKNQGSFQVIIPSKEIRKNSKLAIKAFVNTNGKDIFSAAPDKIIKIE